MRQTKRQRLFHKLQEFIKVDDYTSIAHVLKWEYRKDDLFHLKNDEGLSLVHITCFEGQRNSLEMFLRNGASVNLKSSVGWTPLHAATLGGKLEVVEYLLSQCSADPLAKDEMGCLASDLTMDADILTTLNKYTNELRIRRELERLAAQKAEEDSISKRRSGVSIDFIETSPSTTSSPSRTHSMYVNTANTNQIRDEISGSSIARLVQGRSLLEVPSSADTSSYLTRHNSAPILKTSSSKHTKNDHTNKNQHNDTVINQIAAGSAPGSPCATRFYTGDPGSRTQLGERNRDSGVFDDDLDMDTQTDQLIQKQLDSATQHFNVI